MHTAHPPSTAQDKAAALAGVLRRPKILMVEEVPQRSGGHQGCLSRRVGGYVVGCIVDVVGGLGVVAGVVGGFVVK